MESKITFENFNKNDVYSNEEIQSLIETIDSWTDDQIWYLYDGCRDKPQNDFERKIQVDNIIRIHPHIRDRTVQVILKHRPL